MSILYRYSAREISGRTVRGRLQAQSRAEALARLHRRRLTPLAIEAAAGQSDSAGQLDDRSARDLARTLAQLLRSGLSLAQALSFAGEELQGEAAFAALRLREAAERGERASAALAQFGGSQARLLAGVIMAGETSGRLPEALEVAAASFTRSTELRTRVATSMIYPGFVVIATMATLSAFVFFVVPTLAGAFEGSEAKLPQSTRTLLALSAWLKTHGLLLVLGVGAAGVSVWSNAWARQALLKAVDFVASSPLGLGIAPRLDFAAFAELAALSLSAGVPGSPAFEAAQAGVRGPGLRARLSDFLLAIRTGELPSAALERTSSPPKTMIRLMQVGEATGDLGSALRQAAELLSAEAEQRMQRLGAIAGPAITLGLGSLVGSVVLSLFLGLLAMSDLAAQ